MQRCPGWKACCAKVCGSDWAFARPRMSLRSCGLRLRTGVARMSEARSGARPFRYHGLSDTTALQIRSEDSMNRRRFLKSTASLGIALASPPLIARAAAKELLVAEPVHGTGYLPMYIAMANNYFAESDIVVNIVTIETGSGHTNAVLSGQAFAFIGRARARRFRQSQGRRAARHRALRRPRQCLHQRGQGPGAEGQQLAGLFQRQIDSARSLQRNAEV